MCQLIKLRAQKLNTLSNSFDKSSSLVKSINDKEILCKCLFAV